MGRSKKGSGVGSLIVLVVAVGLYLENPGMGNKVFVFIGCAMLLLIVFSALASRPVKCGVCGMAIDGKAHGLVVDGKRSTVCSSCAKHIRSQVSRDAVKRKFGGAN